MRARFGAGIGTANAVMVRTVRYAPLVLALLMAAAAALTVASVVGLGLHARHDELEIMQLVGSPSAFIRGPFVAEGILQGGFGALIALGFLWIGFALIGAWWGGELAALVEGARMQFLPPRFCAALVAGGMLVGGAGGFAASRKAL